MSYLFHQNMKVFGNKETKRKANFILEFGNIQNQINDNCVAMGFTEIPNECVDNFFNLYVIAQSLYPQLDAVILAPVGAAARRPMEYIAMAYDPRVFTLEWAGSVPPLQVKNMLRWTPVKYSQQQVHATRNGVLTAFGPDERPIVLQNDLRGISFLAGTWAGRKRIFAFMHNIRTIGDPSTNYRSTPTMIDNLVSSLEYDLPDVILGGDFNVRPANIIAKNTTDLYAKCELDQNNVPINTTSANCYDYWLVDDDSWAIVNARVWTQTRGDGLSDHAGISWTLV
jgi:hypothetical protein